MSFRMEFDQASGTHRFTLGCACGARQHWFGEPCYVAWRSKVARLGWKADWPERCPACPADGAKAQAVQGVLAL